MTPAAYLPPHANASISDISAMLKTMAHPERLNILYLLFESERSFDELIEQTGLSSHLLSNHLTKLRRSGIVSFTRFHRITEYRIVSEEARSLLGTLYRRHFSDRSIN